MKFCPNCGFSLEGKLICNCGYNVETGEVDNKVYEDYKEKEKSLYEQSSDNIMSMMMGKTQPEPDIITGTRMMGINPNLSDEEILTQINQTIFNKENDNIYGEELAELMLRMQDDKDKE